MLAKWLLYAYALPVLILLAIMIPSVDIALLGPSGSGTSPIRVLADIFVLSAATGFYLVPLTAAIQAFSPETERARYIGIGNTLSGFAMIMAGVVIAGAGGIDMEFHQVLALTGSMTGVVALIALVRTLPPLRTFVAKD